MSDITELGAYILTFVSSLLILIDKLSNRVMLKKIWYLCMIPAIMRRSWKNVDVDVISLNTMLNTCDTLVRFFNGVDKYDEKDIREFARNLRLITKIGFIKSLILDFTKADMPSDMRKIEMLLRLINDGNHTQAIYIVKNASWNLNLPKYPNYIIRDVLDDNVVRRDVSWGKKANRKSNKV